MAERLEAGAYHGETTPIHGAGGLSIASTRFAPNLVIAPHEHANPFFCFVASGRASRAWPGRGGASAPMQLTVFPAAMPHANGWHDGGGEGIHVEFDRSWIERLGAHARLLDRPRDYAGGEPLRLAARIAGECSWRDAATPLALEGLVLELLAACERADPPHRRAAPRWLARVDDALHAHPGDPPSLEALAALAGVSGDHLARTFRAVHGHTIGEALRRIRIDAACAALARDDASLGEIALATGFVDQSHFSRIFRRVTGTSPARWREAQARRLAR